MESAKLRVLRILVPHGPRALRALVLTCLVPYVLSCLTCSRVLHALRSLCSRASLVSCLTCSRVSLVLRALELYVSSILRVLELLVPHVLRALVLLVSCAPPLASGVSSLTCSYASHVL